MSANTGEIFYTAGKICWMWFLLSAAA